jgi:hypothetical protein
LRISTGRQERDELAGSFPHRHHCRVLGPPWFCANSPKRAAAASAVGTRDLGIDEGTLDSWVSKDHAEREGTDNPSRDDVAEPNRLRAEVARFGWSANPNNASKHGPGKSRANDV